MLKHFTKALLIASAALCTYQLAAANTLETLYKDYQAGSDIAKIATQANSYFSMGNTAASYKPTLESFLNPPRAISAELTARHNFLSAIYTILPICQQQSHSLHPICSTLKIIVQNQQSVIEKAEIKEFRSQGKSTIGNATCRTANCRAFTSRGDVSCLAAGCVAYTNAGHATCSGAGCQAITANGKALAEGIGSRAISLSNSQGTQCEGIGCQAQAAQQTQASCIGKCCETSVVDKSLLA